MTWEVEPTGSIVPDTCWIHYCGLDCGDVGFCFPHCAVYW